MDRINRLAVPFNDLLVEDLLIELDEPLHQQIEKLLDIKVPMTVYFTVTWNNHPRIIERVELHTEPCSIPKYAFNQDSLTKTLVFLLFHLSLTNQVDQELTTLLKAILFIKTNNNHIDLNDLMN